MLSLPQRSRKHQSALATKSLAFDDYPFVTEEFEGASCHVCGATGVYLTQTVDPATGEQVWQCSDTDFCAQHAAEQESEA